MTETDNNQLETEKMTAMTNATAVEYVKEQLKNGKVGYIDNNNEWNSLESELEELSSYDSMPIVCDYSEFDHYAIGDTVATGEEAIELVGRYEEYGVFDLCKHADPTQDAIEGISYEDAYKVCDEDGSLIFAKVVQ
jgi:hypothetical protein